jgi:hypothetical protein
MAWTCLQVHKVMAWTCLQVHKVMAWTCLQVHKEFEDTRREIEICKLKKDGQHNGQKKKGKQPSTKHYTEN